MKEHQPAAPGKTPGKTFRNTKGHIGIFVTQWSALVGFYFKFFLNSLGLWKLVPFGGVLFLVLVKGCTAMPPRLQLVDGQNTLNITLNTEQNTEQNRTACRRVA